MGNVIALNERAARSLKAVRESLGIRSGAKFARQIAEIAGGSPDPSTYNRWERGDQLIPAWALFAASELARRSMDELLMAPYDVPGLEAQLNAIVQALVRLETTVANDGELLDRLAQQAGLGGRKPLNTKEADASRLQDLFGRPTRETLPLWIRRLRDAER